MTDQPYIKYEQELREFCNYLRHIFPIYENEEQYEDELERLYDTTFTITHGSQTVTIPFNPISYSNICNLIEKLKEKL